MPETKKLDWTSLLPLSEGIDRMEDNTSGVYRLSYKGPNSDDFYVFFVAQSADIKKSLNEHQNKEDKNSCIENHITSFECRVRYAVIEDENVREAAFRQVCKFYQPTCNSFIKSTDENIIVNVT